MADYTTITDAQVDPEAPITSELMSALRDNPIAIAEGASGAPAIEYAAIATAVTGVPARGLGSYVAAYYAVDGTLSDPTYVSIAVGTTISGSSLRVATSATASGATRYRPPFERIETFTSTFPTSNTETLSGTWRLMTSGIYRERDDPEGGGTGYFYHPHLWLRIS